MGAPPAPALSHARAGTVKAHNLRETPVAGAIPVPETPRPPVESG